MYIPAPTNKVVNLTRTRINYAPVYVISLKSGVIDNKVGNLTILCRSRDRKTLRALERPGRRGQLISNCPFASSWSHLSHDAFGVTGAMFRELGWRMPVLCERAGPITPIAWCEGRAVVPPSSCPSLARTISIDASHGYA
jgi:hypothetical protein